MLGGGGGALGYCQRTVYWEWSVFYSCYLHQLCGKDWTLVFSKVDRRNNRVADHLAKLASAISLDVVTFDEPPSEVVLDIC
ncbi:hypothetical protein V6N12_024541 [Hibiscus sabdariffa]|uniref:RNase H type-1 domain-containing protein n=1 Tax=Hibiscus sabdariffa TaxID=183260 RepID=A0ABR2G1P4_9ROSI